MYFLKLIFQISFLGLVQGLTEFLPVSSSGHLVIIQHFLPLVNQQPVILVMMLHFGSLLALLVYFWPKRKNIFADRKLIRNIILATIITVVIIFPFRKIIETSFSNPRFAGMMLFFTGIILFLASRKKNNNNKDKISFKESIIVGLGQALAVLPGISRSGLTISTGIFSGLKSERAVEFSFLLAIPIIAGATVLEVPKLIQMSSNLILIYLIGVLVSFIASLFSLKLLIKILKFNQKKLVYFAYYCWLIGLIAFLMI
ncbi:MAG: undecaprenyl-diphosphate phosphatase [Candidatus Paceibacterota bacterium]|jgi:undecaprenyl-diphosphatase